MRKCEEVSQRVTVGHLFVVSAGSNRLDNVECMRCLLNAGYGCIRILEGCKSKATTIFLEKAEVSPLLAAKKPSG